MSNQRLFRFFKGLLAGVLMVAIAPLLKFVITKDDGEGGASKLFSVPSANADTTTSDTTSGGDCAGTGGDCAGSSSSGC